jgi:hypothetical protein
MQNEAEVLRVNGLGANAKGRDWQGVSLLICIMPAGLAGSAKSYRRQILFQSPRSCSLHLKTLQAACFAQQQVSPEVVTSHLEAAARSLLTNAALGGNNHVLSEAFSRRTSASVTSL